MAEELRKPQVDEVDPDTTLMVLLEPVVVALDEDADVDPVERDPADAEPVDVADCEGPLVPLDEAVGVEGVPPKVTGPVVAPASAGEMQTLRLVSQ